MTLFQQLFGTAGGKQDSSTQVCIDPAELADLRGQLAAIKKSQGVIEFALDGTVLTANAKFLAVLGYGLDEIKGKHHRMFVDPAYQNSAEYRLFWERLGRGEYDAGQYKRIGKGGREIWIEASYNPILDAQGKPCKVVKYATDITAQKLQNADWQGQLAAIGKSQGVIEFTLDGTVIDANDNFLAVLGYSRDEARGKHHSLFVDPVYRQSQEYRAFWEKLGRGEFDAGQYKRIGKDGREVWIQASYNPIFDQNGKPFKVVKYATDITAEKMRNADWEGQLAAINKSQGVIEFNLDGTVLHANENFLGVLGYSLGEIRGKHHSLFVDPVYRQGPEYRAFWEKLGRGEFDSGQYKRIGKGGREVWIQASYNPILDLNGKPFKVVKYATDITEQVNANNALKLTVDQVLEVVNAAVAGDLTQSVPMAGKSGMLETLCGGVNSLIENMASIVRQIQSAAAEVLSGCNEIALGNNDLSSRTEQQAASLEETASSMEQLNVTVKQNADNANQANALACSSNEVAVRSGQMVQQIVATMNGISDSSKKITDIIGVIDGIAFQTNILALNAAVEAARAGEQGRGFAVVASEVRNLAQRSATAAKEIKDLIGESSGKVDAGTRLVDQAGKSMMDVVASFQQVTALVTEIANASREQSSGIAQVTEAVGQMDAVTQQNSALVEQSAAAAESLEEQAQSLVQAVAHFVVEDDGSVVVSQQRRPQLTASAPVRKVPLKKLPVSRTVSRPPPFTSSAKRLPPVPKSHNQQEDDWESF